MHKWEWTHPFLKGFLYHHLQGNKGLLDHLKRRYRTNIMVCGQHNRWCSTCSATQAAKTRHKRLRRTHDDCHTPISCRLIVLMGQRTKASVLTFFYVLQRTETCFKNRLRFRSAYQQDQWRYWRGRQHCGVCVRQTPPYQTLHKKHQFKCNGNATNPSNTYTVTLTHANLHSGLWAVTNPKINTEIKWDIWKTTRC